MNLRRIYQKLLPIPKDYEDIAFIVKAHWSELIPQVLLALLLSAIPVGAYFFISRYEPGLLQTAWLPLVVILGGSAWYLFVLLLFFTNFTDFFLDVWIVTNERIITIHQLGLFARTIIQTRLYQVQDVKTVVQGALHSMVGFGNVVVETAGTDGKLIFDNIPHPNDVARKIMELVEADRKYHGEKLQMMNFEDRPRIIDDGA